MSVTGTTSPKYDSNLLNNYKTNGLDMRWKQRDGNRIRLKDMHPSHVRNCIGMLKRASPNIERITWIKIFEDVILKQRSLKIEKIKNKIKSNNDEHKE